MSVYLCTQKTEDSPEAQVQDVWKFLQDRAANKGLNVCSLTEEYPNVHTFFARENDRILRKCRPHDAAMFSKKNKSNVSTLRFQFSLPRSVHNSGAQAQKSRDYERSKIERSKKSIYVVKTNVSYVTFPSFHALWYFVLCCKVEGILQFTADSYTEVLRCWCYQIKFLNFPAGPAPGMYLACLAGSQVLGEG
jgi:hypothetical protein